MNKKIILSVALVAILLGALLILTGCGESENSSNTNVIQVPMTVINRVPETIIKKLYISGAGIETWGDDLLKGQEMPTDTQLSLVFNIDKNNVAWDIKAVDEEGTEVAFRNLDLSNVYTTGGVITLLVDEEGNPVATAASID